MCSPHTGFPQRGRKETNIDTAIPYSRPHITTPATAHLPCAHHCLSMWSLVSAKLTPGIDATANSAPLSTAS